MTLWTVAHQASLSVGFPRQEHWTGLPFPSLGDLPDSGIEPMFPVLAGGLFTTEPPRQPIKNLGPIVLEEQEVPSIITYFFLMCQGLPVLCLEPG